MQQGSLTREARHNGPDVWSFRWREPDGKGKTVLRRITIGTIEEYSTEAEAYGAIAGVIRQINSGEIRTQTSNMTIAELVKHFKLRELAANNDRRSDSTKSNYIRNLERWIVPRWGTHRLHEVNPVEVEEWLRTVERANNTKRKLRDLLHVLYSHAFRYDLYRYPGANPIHWVRQSGKRSFKPVVLTLKELARILWILTGMDYVLILIAAVTGLRRSEIFGLKWKDIDFDLKQINVQRSIVCQVEGSCKTEASTAPVPLHDLLADVLQSWRQQTYFAAADDWVFASPFSRGKRPFWPNSTMIRLKKIVSSLGIAKRIGWHTFRRTYVSLLTDTGVNTKVVQELARHGSFMSTMNIYAQAITSTKRRAQNKLMQRVFAMKKAA